jgi:hypothetical protein
MRALSHGPRWGVERLLGLALDGETAVGKRKDLVRQLQEDDDTRSS